jgi:hypothetical protein
VAEKKVRSRAAESKAEDADLTVANCLVRARMMLQAEGNHDAAAVLVVLAAALESPNDEAAAAAAGELAKVARKHLKHARPDWRRGVGASSSALALASVVAIPPSNAAFGELVAGVLIKLDDTEVQLGAEAIAVMHAAAREPLGRRIERAELEAVMRGVLPAYPMDPNERDGEAAATALLRKLGLSAKAARNMVCAAQDVDAKRRAKQ